MLVDEIYADGWSPKALFESGSPDAYRDLGDILRQRRNAFKAELDKGVTPDEFAKGQTLLGAYEAALHGLDSLWKKRQDKA